jgi:hypothetical protein
MSSPGGRANLFTSPTGMLADGGVKVTQTFLASRPEVLEFLVDVRAYDWGYHATFSGTREQLLAAGVATEDMFLKFGKSGVRSATNEYGDYWTIQRRAKGRFELAIRTSNQDAADDMESKSFLRCLAWREHGDAVQAEVAQAMERKRRTRKSV